MTGEARQVLAFGDFEVDFRRHELRRAGRRLRLQEQPYQVLAALLERPGELVTRDALRARLWPEGTYVEHEKSINVAIMKLRDTLGDSAEEPRFIETLPRLGYRFVAPVEERPVGERGIAERERLRAAASEVRAQEWLPAASTRKIREPALPRSSHSLRRILSAAAALIAAAAVVFIVWRRISPAAPEIRSLAVLPFEDQSPRPGGEDLAVALTAGLIEQLAQLYGLEVLSATSSEALREARDPLPVLARRLGADAFVQGSIAREGLRVRVSAQLVHGPTDRYIWAGRYERQASDLSNLPSEMASDIAEKLGLSSTPAETGR